MKRAIILLIIIIPILVYGKKKPVSGIYKDMFGQKIHIVGIVGDIDLGMRNYDPFTGRLRTQDLLAETKYPLSSYSYAANNPIYYIDWLGLDTVPAAQVDWNTFSPEQDVMALDGVTVTAPKPSTNPSAPSTFQAYLQIQDLFSSMQSQSNTEYDFLNYLPGYSSNKRAIDALKNEQYENYLVNTFMMYADIFAFGKLASGLRTSKTSGIKTGVKQVSKQAAKGGSKVAIRSDIVLSGGRSGQLVKTLEGPANSVLKGSQGRIFITNDAGKVVWDITKDRAKLVIPGQGFGVKVAPTQEMLNLLTKIWGN